MPPPPQNQIAQGFVSINEVRSCVFSPPGGYEGARRLFFCEVPRGSVSLRVRTPRRVLASAASLFLRINSHFVLYKILRTTRSRTSSCFYCWLEKVCRYDEQRVTETASTSERDGNGTTILFILFYPLPSSPTISHRILLFCVGPLVATSSLASLSLLFVSAPPSSRCSRHSSLLRRSPRWGPLTHSVDAFLLYIVTHASCISPTLVSTPSAALSPLPAPVKPLFGRTLADDVLRVSSPPSLNLREDTKTKVPDILKGVLRMVGWGGTGLKSILLKISLFSKFESALVREARPL